MKTRAFGVFAILFAVLLSAAWLTSGAHADSGAHPIVGTWTISAKDASGRVVPASVMTFHADGTAIELDADGTILLGVWEATGSRAVSYAFQAPQADGSGMGFSGTVALSDDGNSGLPPKGTQLAPGEAVTRLTVMASQPHGPMGSPVAAASGTPAA